MLDELKPKKENLNIIYLAWISFLIYLILENVAPHTIYSTLAMFLVCGMNILLMLSTMQIAINLFFICNLLFIIYNIALVVVKIAVIPSVTIDAIITLSVNFTFVYSVYNMLVITKDKELLMKIYIIAAVVSLAVVMFLCKDSLFSGRLAHAYGEGAVSYYFLGKPVAMANNWLAHFCVIAIMFSLYFFNKTKDKIYITVSLFLIFGVILTGSRKGMALMAIYTLFLLWILHPQKKLRTLFIIVISVLVLYYFIVNNPILYEIIGSRLQALIQNLLGETAKESSINSRMNYASYGIEEFNLNPIFGKGLEMFKAKYGNVTEVNYLEILVSSGVVGLIIYYSYLIPLMMSYKKVLVKSEIDKMLFVIAISILFVDIGGVTYMTRRYLLLTTIFIGSITYKSKDEEVIDYGE